MTLRFELRRQSRARRSPRGTAPRPGRGRTGGRGTPPRTWTRAGTRRAAGRRARSLVARRHRRRSRSPRSRSSEGPLSSLRRLPTPAGSSGVVGKTGQECVTDRRAGFPCGAARAAPSEARRVEERRFTQPPGLDGGDTRAKNRWWSRGTPPGASSTAKVSHRSQAIAFGTTGNPPHSTTYSSAT